MKNLLAQVEIGSDLNWGSGTIESKFPNISTIINMLLQNIFIFAGIVFVGMIMYGGFRMMYNAGSDPKLSTQARDILTNGIIGLGIIFTTFLIIQAIQIITGVNILNPSI